MTPFASATRLAIGFAAFLFLAAQSQAELPLNYQQWLSSGGIPTDTPDPDSDGFTTFYEYALGAEPADALDKTRHGVSPYISIESGPAALKFDFKGRQDVVYIFEGRTTMSASGWEILAWKLGPTPWQVVDSAAEITETDSYLTFQYPAADNQFFRLRALTSPSLRNESQAARFLRQATFGPTREEVADLLALELDFEGWIDQQIALPASLHSDLADQRPKYENFPVGRANGKGMIWMETAITAEDQLRQRMAWALAQIVVVGEDGNVGRGYIEEWTRMYDIFVENAFANYRDVLQEITRSPKMGRYLTFLNNRKAQGVQLPDENYAREVMQLFTIGLWELNRDGTLVLDENEEAIPTYDNDDIQELARVFTGFVRAARDGTGGDPDRSNWIKPMATNESRHDRDEKILLEGTVLPAGQNTNTDVTQALDALFNHPNTAPFVSFRLIQRLTCSNPSPAYVDRVAAVFEDDGNGVRGNLAALCKAILLDPEARSGAYLVDPTRGKLREPLIRFLQYCRAFDLTSSRDDGLYNFRGLEEYLGQYPYRSPSVFNFYAPDYSPKGDLRDLGLIAPEFEILDDSIGMKTFVAMETLVYNGLDQPISTRNNQGNIDISYERELAAEAETLVADLNLILTNNSLTEGEIQAITTAVEAIPAENDGQRVRKAMLLLSIAPSYNVLQ